MFALFNVFTIFRKAIAGCQDELLRLSLLLCVAGERAGRGSCNWLGVGEQKGLLAQQRRCSGFREIILVQRIVLKLAHCLTLSTILVFSFVAQISETSLHNVCMAVLAPNSCRF